ncbi:MAG: PhoH family protein, partial [Actinomycetota bacterium]
MTSSLSTSTVVVPGSHLMAGLLGARDRYLRLIEESFPDVAISVRGNEVSLSCPSAETVSRLFEELVRLLQIGETIDEAVIRRCVGMVKVDESPSAVLTEDILRTSKGRVIRAKTSGQKRYVDAIRDNVITFGIGPAGTGKSWLAVA